MLGDTTRCGQLSASTTEARPSMCEPPHSNPAMDKKPVSIFTRMLLKGIHVTHTKLVVTLGRESAEGYQKMPFPIGLTSKKMFAISNRVATSITRCLSSHSNPATLSPKHSYADSRQKVIRKRKVLQEDNMTFYHAIQSQHVYVQ